MAFYLHSTALWLGVRTQQPHAAPLRLAMLMRPVVLLHAPASASHHVCRAVGGVEVAIPAVVDPALSLSTLSLLPPLQLSQALAGAAQSGFQPPHTWQAGMMEYTLQQLSGLSGDEMPILAALVWAVSELGIAPSQPWLHVAAAKMQQGVEAQSFLAPDLCQTVAALGAMGYKPDAMAAVALLKEVQLQLTEFLSDFYAVDVARLASGLADLGLGPAISSSPQLSALMMKAARSKTISIEDKAAVDFALTKLNADHRSMHYDPRWTHEELSWLPRSERDKRRIIKENWVRTQWGGL